MLYRFCQLFNAAYARIDPKEYLWVKRILPEKEYRLFLQQALPDRRHALDVAREIEENSERITAIHGKTAYCNLLHAALLHDCGKSVAPLRIWQRIFIVIINTLPARCIQKLSSCSPILGQTITLHQQHPYLGKKLAALAGCEDQVLSLIENHHSPTTGLEKILYEIDSKH
ncbi:MAG: hypothetical protein GX248_00955 [Peptococcaceae bacterium]|jgi:hypothetical protein|nr:hypothetical protein [Peptococcaceae bacterium]